jgi:hypothetical protein
MMPFVGQSMPDDGEVVARIEDYRPLQRFQLVRFDDIRLKADRAYLVKGVLPLGGLSVVWGAPKCGKSFWAFDLVMHVALGWDYRGRRVHKGSVVYVACEGERGLAARVEAFRQRALAESSDANPPFFLLATRLDLVADVDQLMADIKATLKTDRCAAIVIDTLNRSIAGSESNDQDMGAYLKASDKILEAFGAAVIIIHHCGHNGSRPRGHTSLTGAADAQIAVKRDANERVIAKIEFMKDGPQGDEIISRLVVVEVGIDEDKEPITSCILEAADGSGIDQGSRKALRKLPDKQRRALQLLTDAIARGGEIPPSSDRIPVGRQCIDESVWRDHVYKGGISDGKQNAQRMAFNRAAEALITAGLVGKWGNQVWLID